MPVKSAEYKQNTAGIKDSYLSLSDLCKELSISAATGKNWLKLGKIKPSRLIGKAPVFNPDYLIELKNDIVAGYNSSLKSRRNKKYVSGNRIYCSYISENSQNLPLIQSIVDYIKDEQIEVTDDLLNVLLADCAIRLIYSRFRGEEPSNAVIFDIIAGKNLQFEYAYLISDILCNCDSSYEIYLKYQHLFSNAYIYEYGEDILGLLYISLKNMAERKASGAYYTPTKIVKKLCSNLFALNNTINKSVLDPCCGTGNFILQLPENIPFDMVYGNDIDPVSVKIARLNYALKYNIRDMNIIYSHITESNYLFDYEVNKYDFIIGNPPWGYDFSSSDADNLRKLYISAVGTNIESYDVFVEKSLKSLKIGGILAFVLPEAFLNVRTHAPIRDYMLMSSKIQYVEYLGNAFDKVQCPSIILMTRLDDKASNCAIQVNDGTRTFTIKQDRKFSADCLSFLMTDDEFDVLSKIANIKNKVTLENNAVFALGIVTGNNKEYISSIKTPANEMILKGSDICKFRFKSPDSFIEFIPEKFQQVAPVEYYRAEEKLLYRFICNQLVFAYDSNKTLSLNSCNILIPKLKDLDIKYIMAVLNSRVAQFYYSKKFNSVKVLRSHIEQIPIPKAAVIAQKQIINMVDAIQNATELSELERIYEKLDLQISALYGLTESDYFVVKSALSGKNMFLV